jgi:hypothetical protein
MAGVSLNPFRLNEASRLEAIEKRINRPFGYGETRYLIQPSEYFKTVQLAFAQRCEHR